MAEEILEMVGSFLFQAALLIVLAALLAERAGRSHPRQNPSATAGVP